MKKLINSATNSASVSAFYDQVDQTLYDTWCNYSQLSLDDVQTIVKEHLEWIIRTPDWVKDNGQPLVNWEERCDNYVVDHYNDYNWD